MAGGPQRRIQEEGGSLCTEKSRNGVRLGGGGEFQGEKRGWFGLNSGVAALLIKVLSSQFKENAFRGKISSKRLLHPLFCQSKDVGWLQTPFLWTVVVFRKMSQCENPTSDVNLFPTWNCIFNVIYFEGERKKNLMM